MVALDSRCRQVDFAARVPSNCCKLLSGETPASSSWTPPSFPSPLLPRRLHPHVHDFCCHLTIRLSQCLRFSVTVRSRMGRQRNRTTKTRRRRTGCSPLVTIVWYCVRVWSLQLLQLVHFTGAGTGDVTVFAISSVSYNLQVLCHILFTSLQIFHVPVPVHCILSFLRDSLLIILRIATSWFVMFCLQICTYFMFCNIVLLCSVFLLIFSHVPKFIILSLNSLQ